MDILVLVVNFIDILGHKRSDSKILQEMVPNESAYRKAICSWLNNSWLIDVLEEISTWRHKVFITSDHGSILVDKPIKIKNDQLNSLKILSINENEISLSYEKNRIKIEEIINLIQKDGIKILDISTDDGDLEDVFLRLTKN